MIIERAPQVYLFMALGNVLVSRNKLLVTGSVDVQMGSKRQNQSAEAEDREQIKYECNIIQAGEHPLIDKYRKTESGLFPKPSISLCVGQIVL